jgi:hypothetical protein
MLWFGEELARFGPTTPKPIIPRLLRSIRPEPAHARRIGGLEEGPATFSAEVADRLSPTGPTTDAAGGDRLAR